MECNCPKCGYGDDLVELAEIGAEGHLDALVLLCTDCDHSFIFDMRRGVLPEGMSCVLEDQTVDIQ